MHIPAQTRNLIHAREKEVALQIKSEILPTIIKDREYFLNESY